MPNASPSPVSPPVGYPHNSSQTSVALQTETRPTQNRQGQYYPPSAQVKQQIEPISQLNYYYGTQLSQLSQIPPRPPSQSRSDAQFQQVRRRPSVQSTPNHPISQAISPHLRINGTPQPPAHHPNATLPGTPTTPTSAQPHSFRPEIVQVAATALLPAQSLFENAWQVTVHRVQSQLTSMHTTLGGRLDAEKQAHSRTLDACTSLRRELDTVLEEREVAHKERESMRGEMERVVAENECLRLQLKSMVKQVEETRIEVKRFSVENVLLREGLGIAKAVKSRLTEEIGGKAANEGARENSPYPPGLMDVVQEQVKYELETRVAKLVADVQEQKMLRLQAEKNLAEVQHIGSTSNPHSTRKSPSPFSSSHCCEHSERGRSRERDQGSYIAHSESPTAIGTPESDNIALKIEPRELESGISEMDGVNDDEAQVFEPLSPQTLCSSSPYQSGASLSVQSVKGSLEKRYNSPQSVVGEEKRELSMELTAARPSKRRRTEYEREDTLEDRTGGRDGVEAEQDGENVKAGRGKPCGDGKSEECELRPPLEPEQGEPEKNMQVDPGIVDEENISASLTKCAGVPTTKHPSPLRSPTRTKIGINHIDLLYETQRQRMVCRMCLARRQEAGATTPPAAFAADASWATLIGHCEREHPAAREVLERMSPSQVVELRQRVVRVGVDAGWIATGLVERR